MSFGPGVPCGKDGSISALGLGAFQFCPGVYIRRSRSTIPARPVFLRFGICSEHKSGQSVTLELRAEARKSGIHILSFERSLAPRMWCLTSLRQPEHGQETGRNHRKHLAFSIKRGVRVPAGNLVARGVVDFAGLCWNPLRRRHVYGSIRQVRYLNHKSAVSNSCPVIVPLASVAVFWLPPESRKCLKRLSGRRFKSYRPDQYNHSALAILEAPGRAAVPKKTPAVQQAHPGGGARRFLWLKPPKGLKLP
jgi:hypothetical protein